MNYNVIIETAGSIKDKVNDDYYVLSAIVTTELDNLQKCMEKTNTILKRKNNIAKDAQINAKKINIEDQKLLFTTVESQPNTCVVALVANLKQLNINSSNSKVYIYYLIGKLIEYLIEKNIVKSDKESKISVIVNGDTGVREDKNTLMYYLKTQINLEKNYDVKIIIKFLNFATTPLLQASKIFAYAIYIPAPTKSRSEIYSKFNKGGKLKIYNFS